MKLISNAIKVFEVRIPNTSFVQKCVANLAKNRDGRFVSRSVFFVYLKKSKVFCTR